MGRNFVGEMGHRGHASLFRPDLFLRPEPFAEQESDQRLALSRPYLRRTTYPDINKQTAPSNIGHPSSKSDVPKESNKEHSNSSPMPYANPQAHDHLRVSRSVISCLILSSGKTTPKKKPSKYPAIDVAGIEVGTIDKAATVKPAINQPRISPFCFFDMPIHNHLLLCAIKEKATGSIAN